MNITYITENDKNGNARYYRVTDGKKKVISRAEYEAHTSDINSESPIVEVVSAPEAEESAQIAFEETPVSEAEVRDDFVEASPAEDVTSDIDTELDNEPISTEAAFDIVKGFVAETGSKHSQKMYLQNCKKCAAINYRNCTICSLIFNEHGAVSAVKFMGTTTDTRKKASVHKLDCLDDLSAYKDEITKQIEYVDEWYLNASKKNDKAS